MANIPKQMGEQWLSKKAIDELFQTLTLRPITSRASAQKIMLAHDAKAGKAWLDHPYLNEIVATTGIDRSRISDTSTELRYPRCDLKVTPALCQLTEDLDMVYGSFPPDFHKHYFVKINENGALHLKYQYILGSRRIGQLSPAQMQAIKESIASQLFAREREASGQVERAAASTPLVQPFASKPQAPARTRMKG